jgi:malate dehydrogenase
MQRSERIHRVAGHICQPESGIVTMPCAGTGSGFKVAAIGAGGGIGQPLALLLKLSPKISELRLYDVVGTLGVGADLSHIDSGADLKAYVGPPEDTAPLMAALKGADLVVITAGIARKPGMTRDDLFSINAGIVKGIITAAADACPNAVFNIISNPVNSLVPIGAAHSRGLGGPPGPLSTPLRTPWVLFRSGRCHRRRSRTSARPFGSTVRPIAAH